MRSPCTKLQLQRLARRGTTPSAPAMADEAEAPPPDMERRPSVLDKLKKAASLAAVVSTVGSSVDKAGPAALAARARQQAPTSAT